MKTPNEEKDEKIIDSRKYKINYQNDYIKILVSKTKNNIILSYSYYEIKFNQDNLFFLTKIKFKSINESFEFIVDSFNNNKVLIKQVTSEFIILNITYNINSKEKTIDIYLNENLEDKDKLIKKLFQNNIKLEKEIDKLKENNKNIIEENNRLKSDITNLENNYNINIMSLRGEIMNLTSRINLISMDNMMNNNMNNNMDNNMNNNINNNMNISAQPNLPNFNNINNLPIISERNINVIFIKKIGNEDPINIKCKKTDLISTLIKKYRGLSYSQYFNSFYYNGKELDDKITVEQAGILNNSNILVSDEINILFKKGSNVINVVCEINETIGKAIEKYRNKSNDISRNLFLFNGKRIDESKMVIYSGIYNGSMIEVVEFN